MKSKKIVVIATGGTGGHIFPSLSLAHYLCKEHEIEIFTDERGSKFLQNDQNFKIKKILSSQIFSRNIFFIINGFFKFFISIMLSLKLLINIKPKLIIGMGGYSSFPVCLSGYLLKIPIIIYENNLIIGRANKFLLPFSKKILVSNESIEGIKEKYKNKIFFTGYFIRDKIFKITKEKPIIDKRNLSVLIIGGSQSAKIFGDEIPKVIKKCHDKGISFNLFQQCLDNQRNNLENIYKNLNINFELFSFTKDLSEFYKKSDLVITRCGASSIAELVNLRIPFIAIPLPSSTDNHQLKNAQYFYEKGYCFLLEQKYLPEKLFDLLQNSHKDRNKLNLLKKKMENHSDKDVLLKASKFINNIVYGKI
tara:strand:+ start:1174 stop:2265 length:1092 start_codon:yes stop_codon:yes gene_type:complete